MQQFSILLSWRLFTAQHFSGVSPPIIRSSMTAVAASDFTFLSWWQSCCDCCIWLVIYLNCLYSVQTFRDHNANICTTPYTLLLNNTTTCTWPEIHSYATSQLFTPNFALAQVTAQLFCVWPGVLGMKNTKGRVSDRKKVPSSSGWVFSNWHSQEQYSYFPLTLCTATLQYTIICTWPDA
jgi:hypothetical protein